LARRSLVAARRSSRDFASADNRNRKPPVPPNLVPIRYPIWNLRARGSQSSTKISRRPMRSTLSVPCWPLLIAGWSRPATGTMSH